MPSPTDSPGTAAQLFARLLLIFGALLSGQVIFLIVALFLSHQNGQALMAGMHPAVFAFIALAPQALATMLYTMTLRQLPPGADLAAKLASYQRAVLLRLALLESSTLILLVGYLVTRSDLCLLLAVLAIGIFTMRRPGRREFIRSLRLSPQDQQDL